MTVLGIREPILYEDRGDGLTSISRLTDRLFDGDLLCPGHGGVLRVTPGARMRLKDLSLQRHARAA